MTTTGTCPCSCGPPPSTICPGVPCGGHQYTWDGTTWNATAGQCNPSLPACLQQWPTTAGTTVGQTTNVCCADPGCGPCGKVRYEWNGSAWVNDGAYSCEAACSSEAPVSAGTYVGQKSYVCCTAIVSGCQACCEQGLSAGSCTGASGEAGWDCDGVGTFTWDGVNDCPPGYSRVPPVAIACNGTTGTFHTTSCCCPGSCTWTCSGGIWSSAGCPGCTTSAPATPCNEGNEGLQISIACDEVAVEEIAGSQAARAMWRRQMDWEAWKASGVRRVRVQVSRPRPVMGGRPRVPLY